MGSFNTTCFASNQTIASGDKCRVLAIRQNSSYQPVSLIYNDVPSQQHGITDSNCYPGAFWQSAGEFIEAEYDDYGRVTPTPSTLNMENVLFLFESLSQGAAKTLPGENESHDVPFDFPDYLQKEAPLVLSVLMRATAVPDKTDTAEFERVWNQLMQCWDYVWEAVEEHRVFITGLGDNALSPFQFAVLHEAAFSSLVEIGLRVSGPDAVAAKQKELFEAATKKATASAKKHPGEFQRLMFASAMTREFEYLGGSEGLRYSGNHSFTDSLLEAWGNDQITEQECFKALQPWLCGRHVFNALETLNLKLQPLVYATQDYDNELGQMYAKFVSQVCAEVTAERKAIQEA